MRSDQRAVRAGVRAAVVVAILAATVALVFVVRRAGSSEHGGRSGGDVAADDDPCHRGHPTAHDDARSRDSGLPRGARTASRGAVGHGGPRGRTGWLGLQASQAIVLLERADRTGDMARVDEANVLVDAELDAIDPKSVSGALHHGGPLVLATVYLRYADRPDLLFPETAERLKTGTFPDGSADPDHSLAVYRDQMFTAYDVDGVGFDIEHHNPWDAPPDGDYNGTENHKLQILTAAMLLTEIYADEEFDGRAVKDETPETDDYWHYFRDTFFRYSGEWSAGYPTDHFGGDVNGEEKDASQYTNVYIEDYWLLRDLHNDPIIRAHAEILLDRILIDMAEDTVMGMYTGPAGRYYGPQPSEGINQNVHIIDYLLFDSLGYELPLDHANIWGFATWGYAT